MSIQQLNDVYLKAGLKDKDGDLGTSGFLLSSTGTQTDWIDPGGLSAQTAEAIVQPIKANEALTKGDPLYIVGYQAGQNVNIVAKADSSDAAKMPVVGLADDDYASQNFGTMTAFGSFNGNFDTTGGTENWAIGDIIFVKAGGGLTNIKPTGTDLIQNIAIVSRVQQNTGELEVIALGRTNDVPNLPTGRIWVGDGNTTTSGVVYLDETNNRLGLNTITPGYLLDVQQSGTQGYIRAWDGSDEFFKLQSDGDFKIGDIDFANNGSYLELSDGDKFEFFNGGTQQFLLESGGAELEGRLLVKDQGTTTVQINPAGDSYLNGGDVGIGTISPGAKLDVASGDIRLATNSTYFRVRDTASAQPRVLGINSANTFYIGPIDSYAGGAVVYGISSNVSYHGFYGGGGEKVRITSAGNVGIGTTNPQEKLHVQNYTTGESHQAMFKGGAVTTGDYSYISLNNGYSTEYNKEVRLASVAESSSSNQTGFAIFTSPDGNGASGHERLRVTAGGNVGIGTDSPDSKLQISGSGTQRLRVTTAGVANADLICEGASGMILGSPNGIPIRFVTSNAERARITSGGNVGIGTTNPNYMLHLGGSTVGAVNGQLAFGDVSNVPSGLIQGYRVDGSYKGELRFSTSTSGGTVTQRMVIDEDGNVGIGTTSPAYQLQLSLNSAAKPTSSAWTVVSDERVKTNIRPYETGLEELLQVKPKIFDYNGKAGFDTKAKNNIGVIAQEIKDVIPETVKKYNAKLNKEDKEDTELYNFDSHALTFALINSVKELNAKIEQLETRIQTLENN